jgi:hypothetical protein
VCFANLLIGSLVLSLGVAPASAERQAYVDLQAGLGYSTNPLLTQGDSPESAFGRVSAYGFYGWSDELGSTGLSAFVENSSYLRRYSSKQIFSLNAATSRALSEKVRFYSNLDFSGDFGGQLSSRFFGVPPGSVVIDPNLPDSFVTIIDPDLNALNQRQYRLSGQIGFNFALSTRDSLTTSAGARRIFFSENGDLLNFNEYDGSIGYQRKLSEFVAVGVRTIATRADYSNGRSLTTYGPQATVNARLGTNWDTSLAVGFVRSEQDLGNLGGSNSGIDLALDASMCRQLEFEKICARASRRTQSSVIGASPTSSSLGAEYYRRLTAKDQFQANFAVVRTDSVRELGLPEQSFYTLAGNYDRQVSDRFSVGTSLAARKLSTSGPDPKSDLGGSVFVRYRLGSLR